MTTTINASTTLGLQHSADTSGILQLQTADTAALTINSSQNVGIGTASPSAFGSDTVLAVYNSSTPRIKLQNSTTGSASTDGAELNMSSSDFIIENREAGNTRFYVNGSERMRIDSSGNLLVGGTTTGGGGGLTALTLNNATYGGFVEIRQGGTLLSQYYADTGGTKLTTQTALPLVFQTNATERARIDSSGNMMWGTTSAINSGKLSVSFSSAVNNGLVFQDSNAGGGTQIQFRNSGGTIVGSVTQNGTNTTYSTSSDYRLKENVQPMTGALAVVSALKPCTYTWKSNGADGQGFIAHELQAVVPDAVVGEKDATQIEQYEIIPAVPATFDEEGNELTPAVEAVMGEREVPVYQGIDTSFLVATLTAAIQELNAKITALENK